MVKEVGRDPRSDQVFGIQRDPSSMSSFVRRVDWQPQGAPNDGFSGTQIWGFNFSPINGHGSFQVDGIQLLKP
jgi:hypothetical protein